jgi:tetratricopeptide (TPR) repeat protein
MLRLLLLLWLSLSMATSSLAAPDDEVDHVALAALLIGDGHWDRATQVLAEVDLDAKDLDLTRYHMLQGLVLAHRGLHDQAVEQFRQALAGEDADPLLHLHVARSQMELGHHAEALDATYAAGEAAETLPSTWMLRFVARQKLAQPAMAWSVLDEGLSRFPDHEELLRQRVFFLIELGLYGLALEEGRDLLERSPDDPTGWLIIAESMRQAGRLQEASLLLEEARLRFPAEVDLITLLARIHLGLDQPRAAGEVLTVGAQLDPSLWTTAAECFRQAGDLRRALYANSQVPDASDKAKQRLGLYIEQQDWPRATALQSRLERLQLLDQDALRYALAYAWFQLGQTEASERWLAGIRDARWFRDATKLREVMAACADDWNCP